MSDTTASAKSTAISERRLAANRANARKSTGPKSAAGKKRAAKNAGWHGLGRRDGVVTLNGAERARKARLMRSWAEGEVSEDERECLERAARAAIVWERVCRIDAIIFAEARAEAQARAEAEGLDEWGTKLAVASALPDARSLSMLIRQSTHWNRTLLAAIHEFSQRRYARRRKTNYASEPNDSSADPASESGVTAIKPRNRAHADRADAARPSESRGESDGEPTSANCASGPNDSSADPALASEVTADRPRNRAHADGADAARPSAAAMELREESEGDPTPANHDVEITTMIRNCADEPKR